MSLQNKIVLLLSVAVHIGVYVILSSGFSTGIHRSRQAMTVHFLGPSQEKQSNVTPANNHAHTAQSRQITKQTPPEVDDVALVDPQQTDGVPLISISSPIEPYYFRIKELTERPQVLQDVSPQISVNDINVAPQKVVLRLLINEFGMVDRVNVERPPLPKADEQILVAPFYRMEFKPGWIGEYPVKSQLMIEVELQPTEEQRLLPIR
jgi:hypothetical protein